MVSRVHVSLRKTWRPPSDWPKPPRGWVPPPDWVPDPMWPTAPDGWRWWRVRRLRLIGAAALIILGIAMIHGNFSDTATLRHYRALTARGVTTSADLVKSSYDAGGGDPGGWTTDTVRFRVTDGKTVQTVVGHHDSDQPERSAGRINIVYDPQHPTTALTLIEFEQSSPFPDLIVGLAMSVLLVIAAAVAIFFAIHLTIGPPSNRTQQPTLAR
jgi:hypothetical protein